MTVEKTLTKEEVIAVHRFWQEIQDRASINEGIELALAMIGDDNISKYAREHKAEIIEHCLKVLPDWGVMQDECLSQNCLLLDYLIADKLKELYKNRKGMLGVKEYTVKIKETLEAFVTVEASSAREATDKVEAAWKNGDYILDAEHFQGVSFSIEQEE